MSDGDIVGIANGGVVPVELRKRADAPVLPGTAEMALLVEFRDAARALKQAESAFKAAQLAYAEAVKRLSEEAVK